MGSEDTARTPLKPVIFPASQETCAGSPAAARLSRNLFRKGGHRRRIRPRTGVCPRCARRSRPDAPGRDHLNPIGPAERQVSSATGRSPCGRDDTGAHLGDRVREHPGAGSGRAVFSWQQGQQVPENAAENSGALPCHRRFAVRKRWILSILGMDIRVSKRSLA